MTIVRLVACFLTLSTAFAFAASPFAVGAAPKGDAAAVANKIIKRNFPACKKVVQASRRPDGSISASCDGMDYLVFTVFNPKEGRTIELALNCSAAKQHLNVSC